MRKGTRSLQSAVIALIGILLATSTAWGGAPSPAPLATPSIDDCVFYPDPRVNASIDCGDPFGNDFQPAYVNLTVRFFVNVSDPDPENLSVTFHFDYWNYNVSGPVLNPDDPVRTINVTNPSPGTPVSVETNWTYVGYWTASNFTNTGDPSTATSAKYFVLVEATNETGSGTRLPFFRVTVNRNSEPSLNGLSSLIFPPETIQPGNPVIPLIYANVSVEDPDADPVTVTWFWGDGSASVNRTGPLSEPLPLNVTHRYPVSQFPLNESPRYVEFHILVTVDDGAAHNVSNPSIAEFYIGFDFLPVVRVDNPAMGSVWKVGEPVAMEGNVTDAEGSNITAFWDFDNRTDTNGDGDPTNDRDANGTAASHAYSEGGNVTLTLWATDGEDKVLCLDQVSCTANATGYRSHWVPRPVPITVRNNLPPVLGLSNGTAEKGQPFVLQASVYDPDGDNMTVTWVFDDGSPNETVATGPSSRVAPQVFAVTQIHTFTTAGVHTFCVVVSDGNATAEASDEVIVESFNLPPGPPIIQVLRVDGAPAGNHTFRPNETVLIKVFVSDPENDTVEITIDWADGNVSTAELNFTTASNCAVTPSGGFFLYVCAETFPHTYLSTGTGETQIYVVLVTATDHQEYYQVNRSGGEPTQLNHTVTRATIIVVVEADTAPPSTNAAEEGTLGHDGWWRSSVIVTLSAFDPQSGVCATSYQVDGGPWTTSFSAPYPAFTVSGDGEHTVNYTSTDCAGNVELTNTVAIRIDETPPVTSATLMGTRMRGGWYRGPVAVSLDASDATSGVASTWYRIDGGLWYRYSGPVTVSGRGTHIVEFCSIDVAGNPEPIRSVAFEIRGSR